MFKFGVHKPEQLTRHKLEGFLGRRRFVALDLYHQVEGPEADYFQQRILSRLPVANGTFKYTYSHRFEAFDRHSLDEIAKQFRSGPLRVHDIGVSDGRTAARFFELLKNLYGAGLDFTASDLSNCFHVVRGKARSWRIITDEDGNLIQVVAPPFVFNVTRQESKLLYPINHMVRAIVTRAYARRVMRDPGVERERVEIMSASCRAALRTGQFRFKSYNLLAGPEGSFDVIRVMNLLNRSYFSGADLSRMFAHIRESLVEGGLFIAGSNEGNGSEVNGAIYRKQAGILVRLTQSGSGLAAEPLMVAGSLQ